VVDLVDTASGSVWIHHLRRSHFGWSFPAEFGGFLVLSFLREWVGRRSLAKARRQVRFKGSTMPISTDNDGVDVVGEAGQSHAKWSGILSRVVYPNGVMVKLTPRAAMWLPDQALTVGSPAEVRRVLAENIRPSYTERYQACSCWPDMLLAWGPINRS
jgi:hypothetical protein